MEEKFFTVDEVTKYLNIPKSTIYKLSQNGELPSSKIGKQLRFRKSSLDKWLTEKESRLRLDTLKTAKSQSKSVLLIDDDPLVLKSLARFLKNHGYNLEIAQSGEEAIGLARRANFDLIITDIRMPGMDGIETIKRLRELYQNSHKPAVPEIIITGFADTQAQQQAEELGITDYIYKPFATPDFLQTVERKLEFIG